MQIWRYFLMVALSGTALLSGCAIGPTHPTLQIDTTEPGSLPPLIPVRAFVADWNGSGAYEISPDGQRLMWMARKGLGPGLFVKDLTSGVVRSFAIPVPGQWAQDSRHVLLQLDQSGDENSHVFQLDTQAETSVLKDLTPFAGVRSYIVSQVQGSADLLLASNRRDPKVFDLYRHVAATGEFSLLAQNPGSVALWLTDRQGHVLGRARKEGDAWAYDAATDTALTTWRELFRLSYFDTVRPLEVSADKRFLWALSNRGRDKLALVKIDLTSGAEELVHADPRVDLAQAYISRQTLQPLAVTAEPDLQTWHFFDSRLQAAAAKLMGSGESRLEVTSVSRDENLITATVIRQDGGEHVLLDVARNQLTVLGTLSRSRLHAKSPLPPQRPISFKTRDGLALNAYLTLPAGKVSQLGKPLPTVLLVHGGPWARDVALSLDAMPQFLANRGYAVLQVNYRGSSGYGRAFMEAARGEFAGKMHTDLLDGVNHLVAQGITDLAKVAIMGASYGGYASLVGMTHTPDTFACGVDMVGPSDLASLINDFPPYWALDKPMWLAYVGDPAQASDRAAMQAKSPLHRADQVRGPLLILHGAHDPRVKLDQSTRMVQALRQAGKSVDFHVFNNAGHGVQRWPERMTYFRKTEDFLARCLGGRSNGLDLFELASWAL